MSMAVQPARTTATCCTPVATATATLVEALATRTDDGQTAMKRTAGGAHQWARWMGAATVVLALLALLLRQRDGKQATSEPGSETVQSDRGPPWIGSVEQGKRTRPSSLPRFTPRPEKPGERH